MGTIFTLSMSTTIPMEQVAKAMDEEPTDFPGFGGRWFQLYFNSNNSINLDIIKQAERSGFTAIVFTIDSPGGAIGRVDGYAVPQDLYRPYGPMLNDIKMAVNWEDVAWLKSITHLKIILKGVLSTKVAKLAAQYGADAIIISNHGGRALDTATPTLKLLPAIVEILNGTNVPILIDGGIRRGTDVFKALALGANGVLIGRPILYGLAVNGGQGSQDVLQILKEELHDAMLKSGCDHISDIKSLGRSLLIPA